MTTGSTRLSAWPRLGPLVWVRVLRGVLWLLVLAGPVAVVLLAVDVAGLRHRVDGVSRQPLAQFPVDTSRVEGFAELHVAGFLSGNEGSASPAEQAWLTVQTVSLGAEEVSSDYYAVTVAAAVVPVDPHRGDRAVVRFYTVGVADTGSGLVVAGPPSLVAGPSEGSPPGLLVGRFDGLSLPPGLDETVARFLAAYLAGDGELARYLAPGSTLGPVLPAPFVSVEIVDGGSAALEGGLREVLVVVEGTDETGRVEVLRYGLVAAERDGRWEVVDLLPAPSLANEKNP